MNNDINYMKKAIELSKQGIGYTNPNPLVGAIIVKNGNVIGEGYHKAYGDWHAEINAFNNCIEETRGATMYVTLEPCSHYGKTPPCAEEIIRKGISKVVIGMKDPNPLVSGKGINILKENGIEVICGVLENEIKKLNEIFIKYITTKTPFCILKTAMTLDGKIATYTGDSKWITNDKSRNYVHILRHRVSAIMVGIETVIRDNPSLNVRLQNYIKINSFKASDPIRIIVDTHARIPLDSNVLHIESNSKTIIAVTEKADINKIKALQKLGAEIIIVPAKNNKVDLTILMKMLGKMKIDSVLLEGGGTLNWSALNEGIVDKIISFIAPKIIGGKYSKTPVEGTGKEFVKDAFCVTDINISNFDNDIMIECYLDPFK